jgi:hypothetical protein
MSRMERPGAPEGTTVNVGAAPVGRRDFGLAEEVARVERAALDWGVHVDALEGQFVRALLKAIEETGKRILRRSAILRRCWRRRVEKAKPSGVGSNG